MKRRDFLWFDYVTINSAHIVMIEWEDKEAYIKLSDGSSYEVNVVELQAELSRLFDEE